MLIVCTRLSFLLAVHNGEKAHQVVVSGHLLLGIYEDYFMNNWCDCVIAWYELL